MLDAQKLMKEKREIYYQAMDLKKQIEEEGRLLSKEESALYETYLDKMNDLQRNIDALQSMNEIAGKLKENVYDVRGQLVGTVEEENIKYQRLVNKWMRDGAEGLTAEERRILSPQDSSGLRGKDCIELRAPGAVANTSYTYATDVASAVMRAKKYYGGWLSACDEFTTQKGNALEWPKVDDTGYTGAVEAVGTDAFESSDAVTFGKTTLNSWIYSSQGVIVGNSYLEDSEIDLARVIGDVLGERLWRKISTDATLADGSSKAQGIAHSGGAPLGVLAGSGTITRARLLQLMGKVDYAYHLQPGAGWMFSSSMMYEIAGVARSTTDAQPLWQPSMTVGVPDKLEGFPYWVNNDLTAATTLTAGSRHILFGDFKAFKIRYVGSPILVRLTERYAELLATGFMAIQRFDSDFVAANATTYHPVKYLRKLST